MNIITNAENLGSSPAFANEMLAEALSVKPILFSTAMVLAILSKKKTQTRRLIKPQPKTINQLGTGDEVFYYGLKSKYSKGDVLWVRESYGYDIETGSIVYEAGTKYCNRDNEWSNEGLFIDKRLPSIFMPKKVCRLFLNVTNIKVEKLQDISEEDAVAEGVFIHPVYPSPRMEFANLWDRINSQNRWNSNPYVFTITFDVTERPKGFC